MLQIMFRTDSSASGHGFDIDYDFVDDQFHPCIRPQSIALKDGIQVCVVHYAKVLLRLLSWTD